MTQGHLFLDKILKPAMVLPLSNFQPRLNNNPIIRVAIAFILIIPCAAATLSFNFTSFDPNNRDIEYKKSAFAANGAIQLTANQRDLSPLGSFGGATYAQHLHLWDKASGKLADFTTHFSFVINSLKNTTYADGMAFFLAPVGSGIPYNGGESLGLTRSNETLNSTDNPFVAVEFDIFQNAWDPERDHVGIDINSMKSVDNTTWSSSIINGTKNDAWITYDSHSMNLSVVFTGFRSNTTVLQNLYYIVDLRQHLPEWVTIGFTAATGDAFAVHSVDSWNFSSTLEIDPSTKSKSKIGMVIGLIVGASVLVGASGLLICEIRKRRERGDYERDADAVFEMSEFESGSGPKKFPYSELARATNNFAEQEKLGEGGFGGVYRGHLREANTYVAVKKISRGSSQGVKEYASEVKIISRLRHRNLVQLIGWCHEKNELLLVYEFMPNGSLDSHLFEGKSLLTWEMRYKIAKGIASSLLYLHEEWEQCVVHRDIKSSNVMLDSTFNAKLGDFGLARLVDHEKGSQTTVLAGTRGYMAPESYIKGKASKETDVYSFGVVALEIACGRKPIDLRAQESQVNLVEWVWSLYGTGKLLQAADPKLSSENFNEQEMEHLMIVGLWCAHPDSNYRPSIRQASRTLNFEAPLPTLPSRMPVLTYSIPPVLSMPTYSSTSTYSTLVSESSQIQSSISSTDSSKFSTSSRPFSPSVSLLHTR